MNANLVQHIFRAKLRRELEAADFHLKQIMKKCCQRYPVKDHQALFSMLADQADEFWAEMPRVLTVLQTWGRQNGYRGDRLNAHLLQSAWKDFLRRLSMDSWLVLGKDQKSNGNAVLGILLEVIEDNFYLTIAEFAGVPTVASPPMSSPIDQNSFADFLPGSYTSRSQTSSLLFPAASKKFPETIYEAPSESAAVSDVSDDDDDDETEARRRASTPRPSQSKSGNRGFVVKLRKSGAVHARTKPKRERRPRPGDDEEDSERASEKDPENADDTSSDRE